MKSNKKVGVFKKGMKVVKILHGAGLVSKEAGVVLKVDKSGVWLDNGGGNDPSGPFINGRMNGVFGFWEEILPVEKETVSLSGYNAPVDSI